MFDLITAAADFINNMPDGGRLWIMDHAPMVFDFFTFVGYRVFEDGSMIP